MTPVKIELVPPIEPTAEELHSWGIVRRFKMTRAQLESTYPSREGYVALANLPDPTFRRLETDKP